MRHTLITIALLVLLTSLTGGVFAQDAEEFETFYGITEDEVELIEENPEDFYGETLTVEGFAEEITGPNSFILQDYEPFDLNPAEFLVIDSTNSSFVDLNTDINESLSYRVTGTFWNYDFDSVETELGYDLDEALSDIFDDEDYVMIAESVEMIDAVDTSLMADADDADDADDAEVIDSPDMAQADPDTGVSTDDPGDNLNQAFGIYDEQCNRAYAGENFLGLENEMTEQIEDDPTAFFGTVVTIEGYVDQILPEGFVLRDNEPFDFSPPDFVVVDPQSGEFGGMAINLDDNLCVTGTVYAVDANEIQSELTVTVEEGFFDAFDTTSDDFAIVAENVSILDETGVVTDTYTIDNPTLVDGSDADSVVGVYDEQCSRAYAGENFLGLENEMTEQIEDNPTQFIGTTATIEGYVDQVLPNSFILQDNEPFDFTPPDFVVVDPQGSEYAGMGVSVDANLCVTGTVYPIDSAEIQNDLAWTLDEGYFDQFNLSSDDFAMVAENISVLDEEGVIIDTYTYETAATD